jgi:predicted RNase H-related nuclease YkuK (DUF458 family)
MIFKDVSGQDVLIEDVPNHIDENYEYEIYVGSDSQVHSIREGVLYVTCIVLYKKGKGGRYFIQKEFSKINNSLRERLANETMRSLLTAFKLQEILPPNTEIVIHIDASSDERWKSSNYVQDLIGMVVGQGFKCKIKPNAWAAMSVADKHSK